MCKLCDYGNLPEPYISCGVLIGPIYIGNKLIWYIPIKNLRAI